MWRGVTAVSTLRDDFTLKCYCECDFKQIKYIFLTHTSPILFLPFFPSASFYQKVLELMQIQEIPRISKVL